MAGVLNFVKTALKICGVRIKAVTLSPLSGKSAEKPTNIETITIDKSSTRARFLTKHSCQFLNKHNKAIIRRGIGREPTGLVLSKTIFKCLAFFE